MNKIILVGRLCRDPETKTIPSGKAVSNFTIAVDRRFKNAAGEKEADFVNIVVWGSAAEAVGKFTSKGSQVSVCGRLQIRTFDAQDGTKKYITEVIADEVNFLSSSNPKPQDTFSPKITIEETDLAMESDDLPF